MRLKIYICFIVLFACGPSGPSSKLFVSPELSPVELKQRQLVAINKSYKFTYPRLIPYLFLNEKNRFNEIMGDFFNIQYNQTSNYNFSVGYWERYGDAKNLLLIQIRSSYTSKKSVLEKNIRVWSSSFGDILPVNSGDQSYYTYPSQTFAHLLPVKSKYDIIPLLKKDTITVYIEEEPYQFISPEID